MNIYIIPAALLITVAIILIFSIFSKNAWRGFWIFFSIIFLATLSGQLWITPFGPVTWGISWVPLILVALFFYMLLFALIPPQPITPMPVEDKKTEKTSTPSLLALGLFFWIVIILLLASVIAGYYRQAYVIVP
jgi:hypothetical protein